jgi:hypothetical protein
LRTLGRLLVLLPFVRVHTWGVGSRSRNGVGISSRNGVGSRSRNGVGSRSRNGVGISSRNGVGSRSTLASGLGPNLKFTGLTQNLGQL